MASVHASDPAETGLTPVCGHCDSAFGETPLGAPCPGCGWPRLRYLNPSLLPVTVAGTPLQPCACCAFYQPHDRILRPFAIALCLDCAACDRRLIFAAGRQRHELRLDGRVPSTATQAAWKASTDGRSCRSCGRAGELVTRIAGDIRRDRIIGVDGRCIGCIVTRALEEAAADAPAPDAEAADRALWQRLDVLRPCCPDSCGGFLRQLTDAVRDWCAEPGHAKLRPRLPDIAKRLDIGRETFSHKRGKHNLPVQRWPTFVAAVTHPAQSSTK